MHSCDNASVANVTHVLKLQENVEMFCLIQLEFVGYTDVLGPAMGNASCVFVLYVGVPINLRSPASGSFEVNGSDGIADVEGSPVCGYW